MNRSRIKSKNKNAIIDDHDKIIIFTTHQKSTINFFKIADRIFLMNTLTLKKLNWNTFHRFKLKENKNLTRKTMEFRVSVEISYLNCSKNQQRQISIKFYFFKKYSYTSLKPEASFL